RHTGDTPAGGSCRLPTSRPALRLQRSGPRILIARPPVRLIRHQEIHMKVFGPLILAVVTAAVVLPGRASAQSPPSTVFIEGLTWVEIRDRMAEGATSIIVPTAGTEQKGPHMVMGQH